MQTSIFFLLCLVSLAVASFVWQGFDHGWERTIVGAQTPHRMGTFANYIQQRDDQAATTHFSFTPGVDGDFSYPNVAYQQVETKSVLYHNTTFFFTDNAVNGTETVPEAASLFYKNVTLYLPVTTQDAETVLRGFSFNISCDDAKQPPGKTCNSNGMWPIRVLVHLRNKVLFNNHLEYTLVLEIVRGWTPTNGGGKPFNYKLDFLVSVFMTTFYSTPEQAFHSVPADYWHIDNGTIHQGVITGTLQKLRGDPAFATATMGISGFAFELRETNGYKKKGRYLERLIFQVKPVQYTAGTMIYSYQVGYTAPLTVFNSDITYYLYPVLLQFGDRAMVGAQKQAHGQVCMSGFAFSCSNKGMPEQLTDVVKL